jgi:hypothetical protein
MQMEPITWIFYQKSELKVKFNHEKRSLSSKKINKLLWCIKRMTTFNIHMLMLFLIALSFDYLMFF